MELLGHYSNYRKQAGASTREPLPEEVCRLYGVCVRSPQKQAAYADLNRVAPEVYDLRILHLALRVVVVHELAQEPHNAMLHLFSAQKEQVLYGGKNYQIRSPETTTLLRQLYARYNAEGIIMPITLEEFARKARKEILQEATVEELLERLSPEQRLAGLSPEQRLVGLSQEERQLLLRRLTEDAHRENAAPDSPT